MKFTTFKRILVGQPLTSQMVHSEKISKWKALAAFSSDALSSVAYATEEILIPLVAFSAAASIWSFPVALGILFLITVVTASYRQIIDAYPNGGGAYVVARGNLGENAGLIAAASLLIDYVLTVSVSVAAGVSAIVSAFPSLLEHRVALGLALVFLIMMINLRGTRESASVLAVPTYGFLGCFAILIVYGFYRIYSGDITPLAHSNLPTTEVLPMLPLLLGLRAFSSGCTALTGIEAISNAVPSFQAPESKNARTTLLMMAGILATIFLSLTLMAYHLGVMPDAQETVVSQIARGVFGTSPMYYAIQATTALILIVAANASYAGFPWLAALLAKDRYLPRQFAVLGDKLVYSNSIIGLSIAAAGLIVLFGGETHSLIPLYAVGVFLGFTLSQAGMLGHHLRNRRSGWRMGYLINFVGAITTGVVVIVIGISKFSHGAWVVVVLIPVFFLIFGRIKQHYVGVGKELALPMKAADLKPYSHTVVIPISGIHRGVLEALKYSIGLSDDVRACYVEIDPEQTESVRQQWTKWAPHVPLVCLKSQYRSVVWPILNYLDVVDRENQRDLITVVIPEFVTAKWWHQFLHNQTAFVIRTALLFHRNKVVTSVRYHLKHT